MPVLILIPDLGPLEVLDVLGRKLRWSGASVCVPPLWKTGSIRSPTFRIFGALGFITNISEGEIDSVRI